VDIVAWYTTFESYLHHLNIGPDLIPERDLTLRICGNIRKLLKDAGPDPAYYSDNLTEDIVANRNANITQIRETMLQYPINILYNFDLIIRPDLFMEVLLNNFRNEMTSYQSFIFKFKKQMFIQLRTKIQENWDIGDLNEVDRLELKLEQLNEQILRDNLENSNLFDVLNNEKMTPHFLKLAKIKSGTGTLADVKDDNGNPFNTDTERETYIYDHFQDIYGKQMPAVTVNDILEFLGPVISEHELVLNKKLPEALKNDFEIPLSPAELDCAVNSAKQNSAGGSDGINNKVLKKFWYLFRTPLYEYAKLTPTTGSLTQSFNGASIRLIPKKGDTSKITNWRPISLLNCIYKVISRAVNNRLQKAAPLLLTRAQKGFVKNRYIVAAV
jgi:hypothetical protein